MSIETFLAHEPAWKGSDYKIRYRRTEQSVATSRTHIKIIMRE